MTTHEMSIEECLVIAANGGELAWGGDAHIGLREVELNPRFSARRIATHGCGNMGTWILVGKDMASRVALRHGRENRLKEKGVPANVAYSAAVMKYGMELSVAFLAADLVPLVKCSSFTPNSRKEFGKWSGIDLTVYDMSMPRILAAIEIARASVIA